ncbi:hypothetical protein [Rhodoferax saidenbachensis]|uniref:Fe2OG dioxygenase domain-containing protein n=1 Tax=Rhodoferax saidenbachensis TaxID=1484693 RepID=A0A1P8KCZ0_9BURK|nr:hypothetical protein [Rhodoferax saidenbachensis]APW43882.1 hypothetical protein RS694_15980 [Rhodoferax saidenbachensis]
MTEPITVKTMPVDTQLPVFVCDLSSFTVPLQLARQAIDEVRATHPDSTPSNVQATYMSPWQSHALNPRFGPLCHSVVLIAQNCARQIGGARLADLNMDMVVSDCWGALYGPGDLAKPHNHFPADFGAVVYLEAEPGCAPIVFGGRVPVQPVPGTLVLFPGILTHEVPPTAGRRVVVAMNLHKKAMFPA